MDADPAQWAALVGTLLGSMAGSWLVARRVAHKPDPPAPPAPQVIPVGPEPFERHSLHDDHDRLEQFAKEIQALKDRVRTLEVEALTMEEFQAYTTMDGERRERLIVKLAEMQGSVATLLQSVRK